MKKLEFTGKQFCSFQHTHSLCSKNVILKVKCKDACIHTYILTYIPLSRQAPFMREREQETNANFNKVIN